MGFHLGLDGVKMAEKEGEVNRFNYQE